MSIGLVMEGGAMRALFTAGVIDVLMENGIEFDGAVGTSAGVAFGCNYKSRQIGRVIRYNKKYCKDKRYVSLYSWLTTGDLFGVDFGYNQIPNVLDPFDIEEFCKSPMEFYVTCTDIVSGEPVYYKLTDAGDVDIKWMQASASMPIAARIVNIDGRLLLDGGMTDSIPVKFFREKGYNRNVVILTQPLNYKKGKMSYLPLMKLIYRKYPKLIKALETRHINYNATLDYIKKYEAEGDLLVIRPPEPLNIKHVCHDPRELERVYQVGRKTCAEMIDAVREFVKE